MGLLNNLRGGWRYARGLPTFFEHLRNAGDPATILQAQLATREERFLNVVHNAIFANPRSPYLPLFTHAGVSEQDLIAEVQRQGLEPTLRQLYDAGVYITLDEFKGRAPIVRPGLELPVVSAAFDNPFLRGHIQGVTGGSRTQGTRIRLDLSSFEDGMALYHLRLQAHGLTNTPQAFWRPAMPSVAALAVALKVPALGVPVLRWYSQTRPGPRPPGGITGAMVHGITSLLTWFQRTPIPYPRHVPNDAAEPIARWLAKQTRRDVRIYVDTLVSSAIILCRTAAELGLDISGHLFMATGEPLTPAKAMVIRGVGCSVISTYGITEAGGLGFACATPNAVDDLHLFTHHNAFLQLPKEAPGWAQPVGALYLSVLRPNGPKVMLNVETGDYGILSVRQCGCLLGQVGLTTHLHTIRSYEKLTSTGMHFMGADLLDLLEVALPQRYGGAPTDYQFVEAEEDAQTVLKLVIHPRLPIDDAGEVKAFVLRELERRTAGGRLMTDIWRDSDTLRIERARPYLTGSAKIQPLHVMTNRLKASR